MGPLTANSSASLPLMWVVLCIDGRESADQEDSEQKATRRYCRRHAWSVCPAEVSGIAVACGQAQAAIGRRRRIEANLRRMITSRPNRRRVGER